MPKHPVAAAEFLVLGSIVAALSLAAPVHALPLRRPAGVSCVPEERDALLAFKDGITSDPGGHLDSWRRGDGGREDCCRWRGVRCSNRTGHVLALRLRNAAAGPELDDRGYYAGAALVGRISPSLISLSRIRHLDLSRNYLEGAPAGALPAFLGGLKNLRYLNLSGIYFSGEVPPQLGNLSRLRWLDLSSDFDAQLMRSSDLSWLMRLPSLQHLSLSSVDLSRARDWPRAVNMLPSLNTLHLSSCSLPSAQLWRLPPRFHNLTNLEELDLSMNYFNDSAASSWFWNVTSLRYLNLMGTHLYGQLPDALEAMASLQILDFSYNGNMATMPRSLRNLCNLRVLDLDSSLAGGDIIELLETLPQRCRSNRLQELYLPNNGICGTLPNYSKLMHLTGLRVLDLCYNNLTGSIPLSMGNLTGLDNLDLSFNNLTGLIPAGKGYFAGLSTLVLSDNNLIGNIPAEIGYFGSLTTLDLYGNYLTGHVPYEIGMLANLTYLDISMNDLDGVITEEHFASLASLTTIDLSQNWLKIEVGSEWRPPFRLEEASFELCLMGPLFPAWLQWQLDLSYLDISSTGITDRLPDWFSTTFSRAVTLEMSNNTIYGGLPTNMEIMSLEELYLGSNELTGHIPRLPRNITIMDISMNSLSGPLPSNLGDRKLQALILFSNRNAGHIPESICELQNLFILDLANNLFMGELPTCSGMEAMRYLLLSNNSFSGKFPSFVQSCTSLGFLDLAWNSFSGTLPMWIGDLVQLQFLRLSYNMFSGNIPIIITKLKLLHHLNLAGNNISGAIPWGLSSLTAMTQMAGRVDSFPYQGYAIVVGEPGNSLSVVTKGQELNYGVGILEMVSIDLSLNGLTGVIPEELGSLDALVNLNLSWNHLSGKIPDKIGALRSLESLDLSKNMLSGEIPSSLSNITYLSFLDLSGNNLTGRIPSGSQLDTLYEEHPYMYSGNSGLCGPPLQKNCSGNDASKQDGQKRNESSFKPMSFYFGLGLGFMFGLWVVFCILLFKKAWRIAYFRLFDKLYDQTYVFVVVNWKTFAREPTNVDT